MELEFYKNKQVPFLKKLDLSPFYIISDFENMGFQDFVEFFHKFGVKINNQQILYL